MISVIMSVLDDTSQTSQGSNIRRKESLDYVVPDNIRRIRNMEDTRSINNIEDKRNMLNIVESKSLEERRSMKNREEMKNIDDMKSFRNMEQNTRDIEKLEDSLVRLDTGDSQRTDYFFIQGSSLGSTRQVACLSQPG